MMMNEETKNEEYRRDGIENNSAIELIQAEKISKELKTKIIDIGTPGREEIKAVVDLFYRMQDMRKRLSQQIKAIKANAGEDDSSASTLALDYCLKQVTIIETNCKDILQLVSESSSVGRWCLQIVGMGPVLTAGCLAYFDVTGKEYATQFISYAGLNDNNRPFIGKVGAEKIMKEISDKRYLTDEEAAIFSNKTQWSLNYLRSNAYVENKGWNKEKLIKAASKIPYNADLKTLCWKIGSSFQWQCNNENSMYGMLFSERRAKEIEKNENGEFAEQAAVILKSKNIGKDTAAYKAYIEGKLPKAHITARAMRWTEKLFVSHLFEEMYRETNHKIPPRYYTLAKDPMHNKEIAPEVPYTWYDKSENH